MKEKHEPWPIKSTYEVYIQSYFDSNADGKGDLEGLRQKLDFIKSLNIDAIKLSPIAKCASPSKDNGYDIVDYLDVEPDFGDKESLKTLVDEAHEKSLKVIADFVPNHTSSQHPWFLESRKSKDNPYRDFYYWRDPKGYDDKGNPIPPSNSLSEFDGISWTFDPVTKQFYYGNFSTDQPDLNYHNPLVTDAMLGIFRGVMDMGFDGVRFDAIRYPGKDPNFPDEPDNPDYLEDVDNLYKKHLHSGYTRDLPARFPIIKKFVDIVREKAGRISIGEAYSEDLQTHKDYYDEIGNDRYANYDFGLIFTKWNAKAYKQKIKASLHILDAYDTPAFNLGNHDRKRLATRVKGEKQARIANLILITTKGMPIHYYGDELGMVQADVPQDRVKDVLGLHFPEHGRDGARTPMQWSAKKYGGFSTVEPYQYMDNDYLTRNVEAQEKDPRSFLNFFRKASAVRMADDLLLEGSQKFFDAPEVPNKVLGYEREYEGKKVIMLANFSNKPQKVSLDQYANATVLVDTSMNKIGAKEDLTNFTLAPNEGYLFSI